MKKATFQKKKRKGATTKVSPSPVISLFILKGRKKQKEKKNRVHVRLQRAWPMLCIKQTQERRKIIPSLSESSLALLSIRINDHKLVVVRKESLRRDVIIINVDAIVHRLITAKDGRGQRVSCVLP